jgi:hypothetical protein
MLASLRAGLQLLRARRDRALAASVGAVTVAAFAVLQATGAATANYDARSHLVVARRIFDSLTPGWAQHGVLWLPLPHLLALPLVVPDALYHSGLGVALLSLAATLAADVHVWRLARRLCGDDDLAVALATLTFGLNPNVVYAAATALSEPLLLYWLAAAADALATWHASAAPARRPVLLAAAGGAAALACATRYEAWPFLPAAALWVAWVGRPRDAARFAVAGALGPLAVLLHTWVVAGDPLAFRVLAAGENPGRGIWQAALWAWTRGLLYYTGIPLVALFLLAAVDAARAVRRRAALGVAFLLLLPGAMPAAFYLSGHLFRFRYALVAAPAVALFCGWAAVRQPRLALAAAALHLAWLVYPLYPWYRSSLYLESNWHLEAEPERGVAAALLRARHDGRRVLASMAALAPLLWESRLPLADVVHEGNGALRDAALASPRAAGIGWIVLDRAPGAKDPFAAAADRTPRFFDGFALVFAERGLEIWRAAPPDRDTAAGD